MSPITRKLPILCLILLWVSTAGATTENAAWSVYSNRDFIMNMVYSGNTLWVGSTGGLEQRDALSGEVLAVHTRADHLPDNFVQGLWADPDGGLWTGTMHGLVYRNPGGQWRVFTTADGMPHNDVGNIVRTTDGAHWMVSAAGLVRYADDQWETVNLDNTGFSTATVFALAPDTQGGIWAGNESGQVVHGDTDGQWTLYHSAEAGLQKHYEVAEISVMVADGEGGVWVGTAPAHPKNPMIGGVAHLSAAGEWDAVFTDDSGLITNGVTDLALGADGTVWVATQDAGVVAIRPDGTLMSLTTANSALTADAIGYVTADSAGGVWIGTLMRGLLHFDPQAEADLQWQFLSDQTPHLPSNIANGGIIADDNGLWVGTYSYYTLLFNTLFDVPDGGLAYLDNDGGWQVYTTENAALPNNNITALTRSPNGVIWVGTLAGLARIENGNWQSWPLEAPVFSLAPDGDQGVWVGTFGAGLFYRSLEGAEGLRLPSIATDQVSALASDGNGGLWAGFAELLGGDGGLAHLRSDGSADSYTAANSALPAGNVTALARDSGGGLWIGTISENASNGGLAYLSADGSWRVYRTNNSALPGNHILSLYAESDQVLWVGTANAGLARFADGEWDIYDTDSLPHNSVYRISGDGLGGVWVGTLNGLAHLSFGRKTALAAQLPPGDDNGRTEAGLLQGGRAALIIHPRGHSSGYNQERAIDFMASYAYHSLFARGYDNDEIYFLSHKPDLDFNADDQADFVIDAPVTLAEFRAGTEPRDLSVADVRAAFAWAAAQGSLDEPLVVVFVDHGIPDGLLLEPTGSEVLTSEILRGLLDNYQTATGNDMVVILEACHTGTLLPALAAPGRVIVTSTDAGLAYYDDLGRGSFIKLFFDQLRAGENYREAVDSVQARIREYRAPLNRQQPRLEDSAQGRLARDWCLNGCFGGLPGELVLNVETPAGTVPPGEAVELQVQTRANGNSVRRVWASVITPRIASQRNEQGYSRLPAPVVNLRSDADGKWRGHFNQFDEQGEYVFSVKARDGDGFVSEAKPLILSVDQGQRLQNPRFDAASGLLDLPAVTVPDGSGELRVFQAQLQMLDAQNLVLQLLPASLAPGQNAGSFANFSTTTGVLYLPLLEIPDGMGGTLYASLSLRLMSIADLRFQVDTGSVTLVTGP